jgi:hypothetical protein
MKKTLLFLLLMQGVSISMPAQTHYGTSAGILGANHSYFGYYAGKSATNSSTDNSFLERTVVEIQQQVRTILASVPIPYILIPPAIRTQPRVLTRFISIPLVIIIPPEECYSNTSWYHKVANGYAALFSNTIGHENTAMGSEALRNNTTGNSSSDRKLMLKAILTTFLK